MAIKLPGNPETPSGNPDRLEVSSPINDPSRETTTAAMNESAALLTNEVPRTTIMAKRMRRTVPYTRALVSRSPIDNCGAISLYPVII